MTDIVFLEPARFEIFFCPFCGQKIKGWWTLKPILPPRYGYVEVMDKDGNHVYKKVSTPEGQLDEDKLAEYIKSGVDSII